MKVATSERLKSVVTKPRKARQDWSDPHTRRAFLDALVNRSTNGKTKQELLYNISYNTLYTNARGLVGYYNNSSTWTIVHEYPEYAWKPWRFEKTPKDWWQQLGQMFKAQDVCAVVVAQELVEELETIHNISKPADWLAVSREAIGESLMQQFEYLGGLWPVILRIRPSLTDAFYNSQLSLQNWLSIEDSSLTSSPDNLVAYHLREFMEFIKRKYGISETEELYSLQFDNNDLIRLNLLGGLYNVLKTAFPQQKWNVWQFSSNATGRFWWELTQKFISKDEDSISQVREYMEYLSRQLNFTSPLNWEKLSLKKCSLLPVHKSRIEALGGLQHVLTVVYPKVNWKFSKRKKEWTQMELIRAVDHVLPKHDP